MIRELHPKQSPAEPAAAHPFLTAEALPRRADGVGVFTGEDTAIA